MDWMEFVADLASSVAWPLAFVAAALLFRSEVKSLLGRIRTGEAFGTKFTFGDDLSRVEEVREQAEAAADSLPTGKASAAEETGDMDADLIALALDADDNPSFSVIRAWDLANAEVGKAVDIAVTYALAAHPEKAPRGRSPDGIVRWLAEIGVVPHAFNTSYVSLRALRNRVAHGQENPTAGEAVAYIESVDWLAREARKLHRDMVKRMPFDGQGGR